jgi:ankyrin repeat protein
MKAAKIVLPIAVVVGVLWSLKVWVYDPYMALKKIEAAGYKLNANYLTYFAAEGDYEWVKTYLIAGISPNARTHYDNSFPYRWVIDFDYPIIAAAQNRHIEIFRLLIEHGANAFIGNNQGKTAWMIILQQGFIEAVKLLIEKGADVNSALIFTARNCPFEVIKLLIEKGADVNVTSNNGRTALMEAASNGSNEAVKLLIEKGADVNAKDNDGRTALMEAASRGNYAIEIVKFLIEKGADVNAKDNDGRSAYDHTSPYSYYEEVRNILRQHGGRSGSGS